jgi:hypothetical protein
MGFRLRCYRFVATPFLEPARVNERERVIVHIAKTIQSLTIEEREHEWIGAQEAAEHRIVVTALHVRQGVLVVALVTRIAHRKSA